MSWDNLVSVANKTEARTKIQGSSHLNQWCPKKKQPQEMSLNSRYNQTNKKATTAQANNKANKAK